MAHGTLTITFVVGTAIFPPDKGGSSAGAEGGMAPPSDEWTPVGVEEGKGSPPKEGSPVGGEGGKAPSARPMKRVSYGRLEVSSVPSSSDSTGSPDRVT